MFSRGQEEKKEPATLEKKERRAAEGKRHVNLLLRTRKKPTRREQKN